jgi:putative phosphoribosyl transferase
MIYRDRSDAGEQLAEKLREHLKHKDNLLVLALPRGGVPIGYEIAKALDAPLDVFIVRKLGVPGHEELAMGAIASGGTRVLNDYVIRQLRIKPWLIDEVTEREKTELRRREALYRQGLPPLEVAGKNVIIVDDGLATGSTMLAAVRALKQSDPQSLLVAVPVGAPSTCAELRREADDVVCLDTPEPFTGVGQWYDDFSQTSDDEVRTLLARARSPHQAA